MGSSDGYLPSPLVLASAIAARTNGPVGEVRVAPKDEAVAGPAFTPPKYGVSRLGPAHITAHTPGGGGWGDPFTRPAEMVLRDVRDGVVSPAAAARDYGVIIAQDGLGIDEEATNEARRSGSR